MDHLSEGMFGLQTIHTLLPSVVGDAQEKIDRQYIETTFYAWRNCIPHLPLTERTIVLNWLSRMIMYS